MQADEGKAGIIQTSRRSTGNIFPEARGQEGATVGKKNSMAPHMTGARYPTRRPAMNASDYRLILSEIDKAMITASSSLTG